MASGPRSLRNTRRAWREQRFEARLARARRRLRNGDYAAAARRFAPLQARRPGDALIRWELSSARWLMVQDRVEQLWNDGDEAAAVALIETAAVAFPDEPEFPLWLGPVAVVQGRFDDAAGHAARAALLAPADPSTLLRAARFGHWGDHVAARSCLETVKDILARRDPDEPFALLGDLPRLEAQLRWAEGRRTEAVQLFRHAARLHPTDQYIVADLVQALVGTGDHDGAEEVLDDALITFPKEPRLLELKARTGGA